MQPSMDASIRYLDQSSQWHVCTLKACIEDIFQEDGLLKAKAWPSNVQRLMRSPSRCERSNPDWRKRSLLMIINWIVFWGVLTLHWATRRLERLHCWRNLGAATCRPLQEPLSKQKQRHSNSLARSWDECTACALCRAQKLAAPNWQDSNLASHEEGQSLDHMWAAYVLGKGQSWPIVGLNIQN